MNSGWRGAILTGMMVSGSLLSACDALAADKLKLLIVDGQNNHNWRATTPILKTFLEGSGRFAVEVATTPTDPKASPADWDKFRPEFSRYDVVLSNYNGQPWPDAVKKSLEDYVSSGVGW